MNAPRRSLPLWAKVTSFIVVPDQLRRTGAPPPGLTVTTIPNDDTLPMQRDVLMAAAGDLGPALERAAVITLVHASGSPGPRQGLLRWTAFAAAVAAEDGGVVVDLDTLKVANSKDFLAGLGAADWLETQVVPQAWQAENGTVGFATRGMARFGLPDVERTGVPKETARLAFGHFQAAINEIQARGKAAVGDQLSVARLVACERPPEAYTGQCVALAPP